MLSGCGQEKNTPVHIFSADSETTPAQSSSNAGSPTSHTSQDSASETPADEEKTILYSNDPENPCSITFDGESITVKGKYGDLFSGAHEIYPPMNIESSLDGDILTCVLTPKSTKFNRKFGSFAILDASGYNNAVHIDLSNGSLVCPDMTNIVQINQRTADAAVTASEAKVAQYITTDGSRGRIPQILNEIQKISDDICKDIESDYEKLRAISRWVSDNIYYDHPAFSSGAPQECNTLEYMLNNHSGICGGYSNMTSALCAAQGIRCLNISGMAINNGKSYLQNEPGEFHEWNVAEIDGRQIIVDSGWNSGNNFNYDGTFNSGPPCYMYFDISGDVFAFDHKAQSAEYRDYWSLVQ